jgi:Rrf2 family transcriptional regulator, iron-sulfur cluster assembly transcription factor
MVISKRCTYGIQAAIYIASQPPNHYIQINVIASKLNVSFHFLTKVLQQLTHAGMMASYRGPNGGIMLSAKPDEITLFDLITAIDGDIAFTQCVLGLPGCGTASPCPAHDSWSEVRTRFVSIAKSTTLATLAKRAELLAARTVAIGMDAKPALVAEVAVSLPA